MNKLTRTMLYSTAAVASVGAVIHGVLNRNYYEVAAGTIGAVLSVGLQVRRKLAESNDFAARLGKAYHNYGAREDFELRRRMNAGLAQKLEPGSLRESS